MAESGAGVNPTTVLVDRYHLQRRLGVGGMGEVWEATDSVLQRQVAVKLVRGPHRDDEAFRARFEREAQTAGRLVHPNLATVYDYGDSDEGLFLVMELLAGETLAERLRRGPLPPSEAAMVVAEAADALATAHRDGIVHRDVKPSNLMLGDAGTKVMDFGIATGGGESLTATGAVIGTAAYLAPERLRGEAAQPEADVYALGAVLFEAVSGRPAFAGENPAMVAAAHLHEPIPDLAEAAPGTPPAIVDACRAALARNPADRVSATDLAARLRTAAAQPAPAVAATTTVPAERTAVLAAAPVVAAPPDDPTPPARRPPEGPPRRSRNLVPFVLLGILALAGVFLATALAGQDDADNAPDPTTTAAAPATTASPTTVPSAPPSTAPASTAPPPTEPDPEPEPGDDPPPEPDPDRGPDADRGVVEAAVGYVDLLDAGEFDAAWARTSPEFQAEQDRDSWEGFWGGFDSITVVDEPRVNGNSGSVVVPIDFDGRTEDYRLSFVPGPDGTWLVDGPVGR